MVMFVSMNEVKNYALQPLTGNDHPSVKINFGVIQFRVKGIM